MQFKSLKEFDMAQELLYCEDYNTKYGFAEAIDVKCSRSYKYIFLDMLEELDILTKNGHGHHLDKKLLWRHICESKTMKRVIKTLDKSPNKIVLEFDKVW